MKKLLLGTMLIWTFFSCSIKREYTLDFCTNLSLNISCDPGLTTFKPDERFYVLLECNQPFIEKSITGTFYYIENGTRVNINSHNVEIKAGESLSYYYTFFTKPGVYEIEYTNEKGEIIVTKKLEVKK